MDRLKQRLAVAKQAIASFAEALQQPAASRIERDAAIQRFEYTVEAVWKLAQRYLEVVEGLPAGSPKAAIRACRETGLFTEKEAIGALEMVDDRNLTAHTYNERLAQQIYDHLLRYLALVQTWVGQVEGRLSRQGGT